MGFGQVHSVRRGIVARFTAGGGCRALLIAAAPRVAVAAGLLGLLWLPASGGTVQPGAKAEPGEARVTVDLRHGWRFRQGDDLSDVPGAAFDDSQWSRVELPHTWNRLGNEGTERSALTNAVQGVGWYRLRFRAPPSRTAKHYFLQFDGVGAIADVWMNGHYLGKHAGAFSRFRFDATAAMTPSGENLLVVKADNSRRQPGSTTENVIPLSGDFFVFGGIYRSASLIATDEVHVDMLDFGGP